MMIKVEGGLDLDLVYLFKCFCSKEFLCIKHPVCCCDSLTVITDSHGYFSFS